MVVDGWHDTAARSTLADRIEQRLLADRRVARVERFGSLAGDPDIPDEFSDIDLDVFVVPGTSDLELAKAVVRIVGEVASVRAARTIGLPDFAYVEAIWFDGLPPYWHVDVRCRSDAHEADAEYGSKDEWATGYTHWMLAVKRLVRAFRFLAHHRASVTTGSDELHIPRSVVDELRALLAEHHRSVEHVPGSTAFHGLCQEVDAVVLAPAAP